MSISSRSRRLYWIAAGLTVASLLVIFLARPPAEAQAVHRLLTDHLNRYPAMQVQDLYKLIHQAALGSEHAVSDTAAARRWMESEITTLGDGPPEPMVDPLSHDGKLVRVHLRPFLAAGESPEALLRGFLKTASTRHGSNRRLRRYLSYAVDLAAQNLLPFETETLAAFISEKEENGFPAAHHSAAFRTTYRPAYRVVHVDHIPTLASVEGG